MAGFECSTFLWKDGKRKDYVALTGHDRCLRQDYERVADLGIGVVREGVRWPVVEKDHGRYDWSTVMPLLEAANACHLSVIWDLCHYGFPDDFDPFVDRSRHRYARYCGAAAEMIAARQPRPLFFTPLNEITVFAGAGTDAGWMHPFAKGRYAEFKQALCRMAIEGVKAIRQVDPEARMVHVDPIIYEVPAEDAPEMAGKAWEDTYEQAYEAWDMLCGRRNPELGGSADILDIVGVNIYSFCQAQLKADGKREALSPRDPRRKPLSEMLRFTWNRYHCPLIIGETSGYKDTRAEWLDMVMQESLLALKDGIDLHGICLYPFIDIPDWQSGEWAKIGVYDIQDRTILERIPCNAYIEALRHWLHLLRSPQSGDADGLRSGPEPVRIADVRRLAQAWKPPPETAPDQGTGRNRSAGG